MHTFDTQTYTDQHATTMNSDRTSNSNRNETPDKTCAPQMEHMSHTAMCTNHGMPILPTTALLTTAAALPVAFPQEPPAWLLKQMNHKPKKYDKTIITQFRRNSNLLTERKYAFAIRPLIFVELQIVIVAKITKKCKCNL